MESPSFWASFVERVGTELSPQELVRELKRLTSQVAAAAPSLPVNDRVRVLSRLVELLFVRRTFAVHAQLKPCIAATVGSSMGAHAALRAALSIRLESHLLHRQSLWPDHGGALRDCDSAMPGWLQLLLDVPSAAALVRCSAPALLRLLARSLHDAGRAAQRSLTTSDMVLELCKSMLLVLRSLQPWPLAQPIAAALAHQAANGRAFITYPLTQAPAHPIVESALGPATGDVEMAVEIVAEGDEGGGGGVAYAGGTGSREQVAGSSDHGAWSSVQGGAGSTGVSEASDGGYRVQASEGVTLEELTTAMLAAAAGEAERAGSTAADAAEAGESTAQAPTEAEEAPTEAEAEAVVQSLRSICDDALQLLLLPGLAPDTALACSHLLCTAIDVSLPPALAAQHVLRHLQCARSCGAATLAVALRGTAQGTSTSTLCARLTPSTLPPSDSDDQLRRRAHSGAVGLPPAGPFVGVEGGGGEDGEGGGGEGGEGGGGGDDMWPPGLLFGSLGSNVLAVCAEASDASLKLYAELPRP